MFNFMMRSPLLDPEPAPAGGGNGAPPAAAGATPNPGAGFDPAAFKKEIFSEFNNSLNGFQKNTLKEIQKMLASSNQPSSAPPANEPPHDPTANNGGPQTKEQLELKIQQQETNKLKLELDNQRKAQDELQKTVARAEEARMKAERDAIVSKALNGINWSDEQAAKDAFELLTPKVQMSDTLGRWVGGDDVTDAGEWVRAQATARKNWQAPVTTNSAGAKPGSPIQSGPRVTMDDLDPKRYADATPARRAEIDRFMQDLSTTVWTRT